MFQHFLSNTIFCFPFVSAQNTQYKQQASPSATSSLLLLPLFGTTRWWSFLYCFILFMSCFVFVVFSFSSLDQENKAAQEFGAYNFSVAMYPILQHRLVEWPNASSSISSCLCGCSSRLRLQHIHSPIPTTPPTNASIISQHSTEFSSDSLLFTKRHTDTFLSRSPF